ncbi:hypothetical protein [Bacillus cereus]|uniref:Serine protease n=1 Tax=Bacillus cereus TaxID=1396 RepID=A0A9X7M0N0_BACCE|nr:hypothetical protein [Bacillus cereus]QDZ76506.1 hypothetical protein D0437_26975 [Bacillus cereus]
MGQHSSRKMLTIQEQQDIQKVQKNVEEDFLQFRNVTGIGVGIQQVNGVMTGTPSLLVFVDQKLPVEALETNQVIPKEINGIKTDVIQTGYLFAGTQQTLPFDTQALSTRVRPAKGGYSVAHRNVTAGTIATCVYDILPNGSINPPASGYGIPNRYYLLSNNHVLANSNNASIGDPILQPGPIDGGSDPIDRIATLSRFIPITFSSQVPLENQNNLVDAAIAEAPFHQIDRAIHWSGQVKGWRRKQNVTVGTRVMKVGRTTNHTHGVITAVNATVDVNYGSGRVARFRDQIITSNLSSGGDSGSLITTNDGIAVGLLFAGSSSVTIANHIEHIRSLLGIEVAENIL